VAEPLKPIGFWSYTSSDDKSSRGRLSQLRRLLADELQLLIGRNQQVHVWQDVAAIPHGTDWLKEIHKALDQTSFFIPIVTPAFLESEMCCQEVLRFHQRQQDLGRDDLIFPFHYIDIADIQDHEVHDPAVLALLKSRQRIDFSPLRHRSPESEDVATSLNVLAKAIRAALRRIVVPDAVKVGGVIRDSGAIALGATAPAATPRLPVPGTVMREGAGPEMVLIPPGRFLMGVPEAESRREGTKDWDDDARPQHMVTVGRSFWLGKYPVMRGEYAVFATATGRDAEPWASPGFLQDDRHPAVNVSHDDATAYVTWLSEQTGQTYRLPSEAEWEYAARAGETTARYWGEAAGNPGEHAHFGSRSGTCPAGSFRPNAYGLHDMLGNVWEWMDDTWHDGYKGAPSDGSAWLGGAADRVVRGGSWLGDARTVRAACRSQLVPASRGDIFGFRCARVQV